MLTLLMLFGAVGSAYAECNNHFYTVLGDVIPAWNYARDCYEFDSQQHKVLAGPYEQWYICDSCGDTYAEQVNYDYFEPHTFSNNRCTQCGYTKAGSSSGGSSSWSSSSYNQNNYANYQIVTFGSYEQDGNFMNGAEGIEWYVVDRSGGNYLLVSVCCLDAVPFNNNLTKVNWSTCSLRNWLNSNFYNEAFNSTEKNGIVRMTQYADRNPNFNTSPGGNTSDNVFILSASEVAGYFPTYESRVGTLTQFALNHGGDTHCWWWLRTPGNDGGRCANVNSMGNIDYDGSNVSYAKYVVRPAIWISESALRNAGY